MISYAESKKNPNSTHSRVVVINGGTEWIKVSKRHKFSVLSSGDVIYNVVSIIYNTNCLVFLKGAAKRIDLISSH